MQLQQACLLAELLLAVLLQHFAETNGDPTTLSRLGDNRVSFLLLCSGKQTSFLMQQQDKATMPDEPNPDMARCYCHRAMCVSAVLWRW